MALSKQNWESSIAPTCLMRPSTILSRIFMTRLTSLRLLSCLCPEQHPWKLCSQWVGTLPSQKFADHGCTCLTCCPYHLHHLFLLSTCSIQEDPSQHNWKIVDWDVKNQIKQNLNHYAWWAFHFVWLLWGGLLHHCDWDGWFLGQMFRVLLELNVEKPFIMSNHRLASVHWMYI